MAQVLVVADDAPAARIADNRQQCIVEVGTEQYRMSKAVAVLRLHNRRAALLVALHDRLKRLGEISGWSASMNTPALARK
ncbi:hypothetical protein GCM10025859_50610 [Alicyclobacillus fastidiosus]|nr:hypothetical protein GCM10025859_50610 [Alicyclobacillus fastidiosus]